MTQRKRRLALAALLLSAVVATEYGLRTIRAPVAGVRIVNEGGAPLESLILTTNAARAAVATIPDGASTTVLVAGRGKSPLTVSFQQAGNPLNTIEIPAFDPAALQREGFSLVLTIRQNEYERFQDDGEPSTLGRLAAQARNWLANALESP